MTPGQMFEGGAKSYDNWVELGVGDLFTSGSQAQAQQQYQLSNDPFGGVSDLHLQKEVAKKTTLTLDGHSLFDQNDYKVTLGLQREDFGYIKFNVTDFRTWYNGAGGFYNGAQYPLLPNNALYLDRGTISVEAGLTPKDAQLVYLSPAAGATAFNTGKVDAWSIWNPQSAVAVSGGARIIAKGLPPIDQVNN